MEISHENLDKNTANLNALIVVAVWFVLILVHSFMLGGTKAGHVPYFWDEPSRYYSTWFLDLFLIGVWYLNYYLLAPRLVRKNQFTTYGVIALLLMAVGLFLPLILFHIFGWGSPADAFDVGFSAYGATTVLAFMALGLSIRSLKSWVKLQRMVEHLQQANETLRAENSALKNENEQLKQWSEQPLPQLNNSADYEPEEVITPEEIIEADSVEPLY